MTNLTDWGFPQALLDRVNQPENVLPARVTAVWKERFQLITQQGEQYARLKTKEFFFEAGRSFPTTGDYVLALPAPGDWQLVETLPWNATSPWPGTPEPDPWWCSPRPTCPATTAKSWPLPKRLPEETCRFWP